MTKIRVFQLAPADLIITLRGLFTTTQWTDLGLSNIDGRYEGILEGGGRCVWLHDGRRVEISVVADGGHVANVGGIADMEYPGRDDRRQQDRC